MHKFHPEFGKYTLSLIILNVKKRLKVHLAPKFIARIGGKLLLLHPSILLDVEMQSGHGFAISYQSCINDHHAKPHHHQGEARSHLCAT
jgi:hypothetical protein